MKKRFDDFLDQLNQKDWIFLQRKIENQLNFSEGRIDLSDFAACVSNCSVIISLTFLNEYHKWLNGA